MEREPAVRADQRLRAEQTGQLLLVFGEESGAVDEQAVETRQRQRVEQLLVRKAVEPLLPGGGIAAAHRPVTPAQPARVQVAAEQLVAAPNAPQAARLREVEDGQAVDRAAGRQA